MEYTTVVAASASESAPLQFIAPYTGVTMGEYFRDNGQHALIVYDDLSKQAVAYRQLSLLLRRPPGREAYPGDVFYLHSRLLERAAKVADEWVIVQKGTEPSTRDTKGVDGKRALRRARQGARRGGTSRSSPRSESSRPGAQEGPRHRRLAHGAARSSRRRRATCRRTSRRTSSPSPTGRSSSRATCSSRASAPPSTSVISVSRVGGNAQISFMKAIAGTLRLTLAQYREMAAFAQFASDLDKATQAQLARGERLTEILKQGQYVPLGVEYQIAIVYAANRGFLDKYSVKVLGRYEKELFAHLDAKYSDVLTGIRTQKIKNTKKDGQPYCAELEKALEEFAEMFSADEPKQ
jgi:F-type H+-transporting ATPase subunit alpha